MKKLTEQQVDIILGNSNLSRRGNYTSSKEQILVKCLMCNHERTTNAGHLLYSIRKGKSPCPKCSDRVHLTNESIDARLEGRKIIRLSEWTKDTSPVLWKCDQCDHTWKTRATKILNEGTGCPKCSYVHRYDSLRLTSADIDVRLEGRSIQRNGEYPGSLQIKMWWKCLDCEHEWAACAGKVVNEYTGCPACADVGGGKFGKRVLKGGKLFDSQLEYDCYLMLLREVPEDTITRQHPYPHNRRMRCDFYLPNTKLWIEVSNLKLLDYLKRIENKKQAIESIGETFVFIRTPREIQSLFAI